MPHLTLTLTLTPPHPLMAQMVGSHFSQSEVPLQKLDEACRSEDIHVILFKKHCEKVTLTT